MDAKTLQIKIEQEQGNYILDKEAFNNAGKIREEILKDILKMKNLRRKIKINLPRTILII